jgi:hypothetical protein
MEKLLRHKSTMMTLAVITPLLLCCQPQSGKDAAKTKKEPVPTSVTAAEKIKKRDSTPAARNTAKTGKKTGSVSAADSTGMKKQGASVLDIRGYRIGMTVNEVNQMLRKRKITGYQTGFSDEYAYNSSPDTEVRLTFACSSPEDVLAAVDLTITFTVEESEVAVSTFKEKLIAKYGTPSVAEFQADGMDSCWGQCKQNAEGAQLRARTTAARGSIRRLVLTLSNDGLAKACEDVRLTRINRWLYQWIDSVRKFRLGMSLKDASVLYLKRYGEKLEVDHERDDSSQQQFVTSLVTRDYDFFRGLDFDSHVFKGEGPGMIILKFTGDEADEDSTLNRRLYYISFRTTKFTDHHVYDDAEKKLNRFIKSYGSPAEVVTRPDGITARWQHDELQRSLSIFDSGLITFEQSDLSLKNAYRDAAIRNLNEYQRNKFNKASF